MRCGLKKTALPYTSLSRCMVQVPGAPSHKIVIMSVNPTNHHSYFNGFSFRKAGGINPHIQSSWIRRFFGGEGINEEHHKSGANSTGHDKYIT